MLRVEGFPPQLGHRLRQIRKRIAALGAGGVDDLHFHDLRHEATSRLFEQGYSIEQVSAVTLHQSWQELKRYTQLRPESLHRE